MSVEIATAIPDLISSIETGWKSFIENENKGRGQYTPKNVWASGWRPCTRRMVLEMVVPEQKPKWTDEQLANFRRGSDRERDLVNDLRHIGRNAPIPFEVVHEQQRFEITDEKGRVIISGKIDGALQFHRETVPPFEVKAWNPMTVAKISCFDDLLRSPWTKPAAFQLLAYLAGLNQPLGFFILDRNGLPLPIPVELEPNREKMDHFLEKAEQAMDAKEAYQRLEHEDIEAAEAMLPPYIQDAAECKRCWFFGGACNPPTKRDGATILSDPELESALTRRAELEAAADEFEGLDAQVKASLRGIELGLCGPFIVNGKWQPNTTYPVPKEIKAQYKKVDEKGKFILSIERIGAAQGA